MSQFYTTTTCPFALLSFFPIHFSIPFFANLITPAFIVYFLQLSPLRAVPLLVFILFRILLDFPC